MPRRNRRRGGSEGPPQQRRRKLVQRSNAVAVEDSVESCLAEMRAAAVGQSSVDLSSVDLSSVDLSSVDLSSVDLPMPMPLPAANGDTATSEQVATANGETIAPQRQLLCDPTLLAPPIPVSGAQRDRVLNWNLALRVWMKRGTYTSGLLPSFDVELARHFKIQALSTYLLDACNGLKMPAFERWLIDSNLESKQYGNLCTDPILSTVTADFQSSQRLIEEMTDAGTPRVRAKKIVKDLCFKTDTFLRELVQQQALQANSSTPMKKGDRIDLEGQAPVYTLVYHRKKWKKPFCVKLNATHYNKLRAMFGNVHGADTIRFHVSNKPTKALHAFHLLLMVLLLRYSSLSGGQLLLDLRGGGMQGAVHAELFQVLKTTFPSGPLVEGFGSPFNTYLPSFGSAFPDDLDWHFGSIGSFFSTKLISGCCEANPPFCPGIMSAMADQIESNLDKADEQKTAMTFVVVVPSMGDEKNSQRAPAKRFGGIALKRMTSSKRCRRHILLSAKEHGYIEGAQHMRPTRYKQSLYDTSVVVLQSEKARKRSIDEKQFELKLREAFVSRHHAETEQRKTGK